MFRVTGTTKSPPGVSHVIALPTDTSDVELLREFPDATAPQNYSAEAFKHSVFHLSYKATFIGQAYDTFKNLPNVYTKSPRLRDDFQLGTKMHTILHLFLSWNEQGRFHKKNTSFLGIPP